jgi:hypothetical protein
MIRDMSSRSSISFVCATRLRSMTFRPCAVRSESGCDVRRIRVQPIIADSGVRSSCESVVRNSSLIRFASRASAERLFSMAIELI